MSTASWWKLRPVSWLVLSALVAASEWLRAPAILWVVVVAAVGLAAVFARLRARVPRERSREGDALLAISLVLLAAVLGLMHVRISRVADDWPAERERRVGAAFRRLSGELRASLKRADELSASAVTVAGGDQAAAFVALDRSVQRKGPEMAVVILEPTGVPWAWAGRHRVPPRVEGDSIDARFTRFFTLLESRRHGAGGRVIVSSVLIQTDSVVPRPERSLAARFGREVGVQLQVYPPGVGPRNEDTFEYSEPTTAGERPLFSVLPVPPDQSVATAEVRLAAYRAVGLLLLLVLGVALLTAKAAPERFVLLAALLWSTIRAPLGAAIGLEDLFSPGRFSRGILAPFSTSAGHLLLTSSILLLFAVWLWERRLPRHPLRIALGILLLLGAPYLISDLGRGIAPPFSGVPLELWLTWQVTLTVATSALIVFAAAFFRGSAESPHGYWGVTLGVVIALVAAVVGTLVWRPRVGWPDWYTFLWAPALFLVARPAPRWATVAGTAIVAGSAAALVTWGAELNERLRAAQLDLARLGNEEEPLAAPYLERLADQLASGPEPISASDLFVEWRRSVLAGQEFPVRLALWGPDGTRTAELALDSLDLPTSLVAALVQSFDPGATRSVVSIARVPGRHYVLLSRLPSGRIATAAVGPRTRLLAPARIARLLRPAAAGAPLYELTLSPPFTRGQIPTTSEWSRSGSLAHTDRVYDFPDGSRRVHAAISLRPLPLLLVRGALVVALDALVLGLLWGLATIRPDPIRQWRALRRLSRAFRIRIALTLALFFAIPAAGFALWGLRRLEDEAGRTRDLLITTVLRDAVLTAGGLLQEPADYLSEGLRDLSNRLDADLALYSGGRLVAASAPVLEDLSLVGPLMDPRIFQRLALGDDLELTGPATTYVAPVRVGYRVAQAGPPGGVGILATPQLAFDWGRTQDQRDLAYVLILATLAGIGAALLGAQLAARTLSRPVADLGRSAVAVGRGQALPPVRTPPLEFEQVFEAFERMASDIQASQSALESARQRTAAVLANVATGVVALDPAGRILLANPRSRQLFGCELPEGSTLSGALPAAWVPVVKVVNEFVAGTAPDANAEVEVSSRTWRLQLARLSRAPGGSVLALDDLTDVTQAARVLAWGEMARQVAHEIKNPLTPIRLGVQHLLRVWRERPEGFDRTLEETAARILSEIDRLDTIARAFSRFGLPGREDTPLEPVDLAGLAREVAGLYRLTADGVGVEVTGLESVRRPARLDEVKEVLGNLLENARHAGARRITIRLDANGFAVVDDGKGITGELLPRIFEPRFSTTTSGSGLGLAIVRRLVESWGARVEVDSTIGRGTTVSVWW